MSGTTNFGTNFNGTTYQPVDINSQNNGSGTGFTLGYNPTISNGGSGATGAATGMAARIDQSTVANNSKMSFATPKAEPISKGVTLDISAELKNAALNGAVSGGRSASQGGTILPDTTNHSTVAGILPTQLDGLHAIAVLPLS